MSLFLSACFISHAIIFEKGEVLSLIVLIAFTLLPIFQVVHISYADHHPPTREEFEELQEDNEDLKEDNEDLKERVEELEEEIEEDDRGIVDSLLDIGKFAVGSCVGAVGVAGVVCATASGAATFGLSAPLSVPTGIVSAGAAVGGAGTAWSASNNLVNDIVNLFSGDDDDDDDDDDD